MLPKRRDYFHLLFWTLFLINACKMKWNYTELNYLYLHYTLTVSIAFSGHLCRMTLLILFSSYVCCLSSPICCAGVEQRSWERRGEAAFYMRHCVWCISSSSESWANGKKTCAWDHLQWKNKSHNDGVDFVQQNA